MVEAYRRWVLTLPTPLYAPLALAGFTAELTGRLLITRRCRHGCDDAPGHHWHAGPGLGAAFGGLLIALPLSTLWVELGLPVVGPAWFLS